MRKHPKTATRDAVSHPSCAPAWVAGTLAGAVRSTAAGAVERFRFLTPRRRTKSRDLFRIIDRRRYPDQGRYDQLRDLLLDLCVRPTVTVSLSASPTPGSLLYRTEDEMLQGHADTLGSPSARGRAGANSAPATGEVPAFDNLAHLDPDAQLRLLIRDHGDSMFRVALSIVRHHQFAEDVTQDALLKAWRALPGFRGDAPLRGWLLRITHNTAVSALRKRREEPLDPYVLGQSAALDLTAIDESVENRAAYADFFVALAELDELSKTIVVLREIEGLSYDEIAAALSVSLPTVKTRLLRARRTLANSMQAWQP